jgi:hypothetical protein
MRETQTEKIAKKKYEKPSMRMINIADSVQVLGTGCKTNSTGAVWGSPPPCVIGMSGKCAQLGS